MISMTIRARYCLAGVAVLFTEAGHFAGLQRMLSVALVIALSACSSADFSYPKNASYAISSTSDTFLAGELEPDVKQHPDKSGFLLLDDGIDALALRLLLAQRAEKTLDAQYYLITNDDIGRLFLAALLQAADRGVRVRLLLDDIQTQGYDAGIAALDSHPNFEVRIFNAFNARSARFTDVMSFSRINRRMHNKSFTVDNQISIFGGRNIAAEYFSFRDDVNFGDLDVAAIGPIVPDVSAMFDLFWNSEPALPAPAFAKQTEDPAEVLEIMRGRFRDARTRISQTQYAEALTANIFSYIDTDPAGNVDRFTWAPSELVYDSPDKANKQLAGEAKNITTALGKAVDAANEELIIISPYFVPRDGGEEYFRGLIDRGLNISVITNSLAANNQWLAHSGYAASRKKLLEMGVRLYEIKATAPVAGVDRSGSGAALATLHTKAFMVDRQKIFIGSFNWDPRSVNINTELGVIIDSASMGRQASRDVNETLQTRAYEVILDNKGRLRWVDRSGARMKLLNKDPDTSWWQRTRANLGRMLPIRGQL